MSKGADRKQRRRDALDRTRELFGDMDKHSPAEVDERSRLEATRGELEAWARVLGYRGEPTPSQVGTDAALVWNLHLGDFVSAPLSLQDFAHCYGKDSKCLDDGAGSTTCFEIIIAQRLAAGGWSAGWWNPYPVPTPLHWGEWELDKAEFRRLAAQIPGLSTLLAESVRSGVADVLALRRQGERLRVVAVECKTETGDPISPSQAVWISQFMRKFGRGSFAIARWRAVSLR